MTLDIDRSGYPLPCDPVSGRAWWRFNMELILHFPGYRKWQAHKNMGELIPVIRWVIHGTGPAERNCDG